MVTVPLYAPVTVAVPSFAAATRALELLTRQSNVWATPSVEPSLS